MRTCALILMLCLTSCGYWSRPPRPIQRKPIKSVESPVKTPTTVVNVEKLELGAQPKSRVELIWAIPSEPVEGYVINYGFQPDALTEVARLKTPEIEQHQDATHGLVYRHVLDNVPVHEKFFFTISAVNGLQVSPPSQVMEVPEAE